MGSRTCAWSGMLDAGRRAMRPTTLARKQSDPDLDHSQPGLVIHEMSLATVMSHWLVAAMLGGEKRGREGIPE